MYATWLNFNKCIYSLTIQSSIGCQYVGK